MDIKPRPKGRQTKVQGFSLYPAQIRKLDALAEQHGVNKSELIRQLVDQLPVPKKKSRRQ